MAPLVTRHLPLVAADDLYEFVGTGDPSDSPGVAGAIGSRFIRTDGASGTVEYHKFGAADTDWEATAGGGGGGSGVSSVTGTAPITASPTSGAVVVSHDVSGVTAGTYGDDVTVAVVTVDDTGHVTEVVETPITFPDGSGGDPGIPLGTPGNEVVTLWTGELIADATSDATRPPELQVSKSCNFGEKQSARLQCVVTEAFPTGTKMALRVLPYVFGSWSYPDGASGPWVALDEVNESDDAILAVSGDWFDVDPDFQLDNLQIELVIVDGDDAGEGVFSNVYLETLSVPSTTPPPSGTPTPPGVPTTSPTLLADWDPTEGSGTTLADKS